MLEDVKGITPMLFGDGAYSTVKTIVNLLKLACGTNCDSSFATKYWMSQQRLFESVFWCQLVEVSLWHQLRQ